MLNHAWALICVCVWGGVLVFRLILYTGVFILGKFDNQKANRF
jgi:hypothetical protein